MAMRATIVFLNDVKTDVHATKVDHWNIQWRWVRGRRKVSGSQERVVETRNASAVSFQQAIENA
jgi:hypothetical protein